jgi:hypothetical protein
LPYRFCTLTHSAGSFRGVWLILLGQWWAIGYGISVLFAPLILGLIMAVGAIFAWPNRYDRAVGIVSVLLIGDLLSN